MKKKIKGTLKRPRLYIFKSNKHIYAQVIDDQNNTILTSSSSISQDIRNKINNYVNCEVAKMIGKSIATKLKNRGIEKIIFDRGNKIYHGKIKALADTTRNEGIEF